jgi:hypothetical protein
LSRNVGSTFTVEQANILLVSRPGEYEGRRERTL